MTIDRTGIHPDSCTCGGVMCRYVEELDMPLQAFPLEHGPLRSLAEVAANQSTDYYRGFADGRAEGAAETLRLVNEQLRDFGG